MKKFGKSKIVTGLALVAGLGFAGQASAYIYAGSTLLVDDLFISFGNNPGVSVTQFTFTTSATAESTTASDTSSGKCTGDLIGGGTNCLGGSNNPPGDPVLYAGDGNLLDVGNGSADAGIVRVDRSMTYLGPDVTGDWASADSVIEEATLVDAANGTILPPPNTVGTEANQISEANIDSTVAASANSEVVSITDLNYTFTLETDNTITIAMFVEVGTYAEKDTVGADPVVTGANASAGTTLSFTLVGDNGDGFSWTPQFDTSGARTDCSGLSVANAIMKGGSVCLAEGSVENLNQTSTAPGTGDPKSTDQFSRAQNYELYNLTVTLSAGTYALNLTGTTTATVNQTFAEVPEPGTVLLFGLGLSGLGLMARRRKSLNA